MTQEITLSVRNDEEFNKILNNFNKKERESIFESAIIIANNTELKLNVNKKENDVNNNYFEMNNKLNILCDRLLGSATKGQVGEIGLNDVLINKLKGYSVINTEKIAHSGDFIIEKEIRIIIDSKLYKNTVSKSETEKLIRDMDEQNINYGILISPTSSISNKQTPIDYEKREDGKYIVFLSKCSMDHIVCGIKLCEQMSEMEKVPEMWNPEISFTRIEKSIEKLNNNYNKLTEITTGMNNIINEMERIRNIHELSVNDFLADMMELNNSLHEEFSHIREDLPFFEIDEIKEFIRKNAKKTTLSIVLSTIDMLNKRKMAFHLGNKLIDIYDIDKKHLGKIKLTTKDSELELKEFKVKLKTGGEKGVETIINMCQNNS